ncbi:MAG: hypothetical protein NNC24_02995 [Candidatus Nanosynbacter sp. P11B_S7_bin.28.1]|nr:hypothetical protein [Candidatus Nanosynbacter sp. P11B_S7_bin.28.1]
MSSTPECVTKTPELDATRKEIADILSDAEQRDNYKVNPELGKTAFDVANIPNNEAVYLCNQALGSYGKSLDYINNSPLEAVQAIGNSLQLFREDKTKESCR